MRDLLSIYGPLAIGLLGGLFGIWQLAIRMRNDFGLRVWEKRAEIYVEYLGRLDAIHRRLMVDFAKHTGPTTTKLLARILDNPEDHQPLLDFQGSLSEMLINIIQALSESREELNKLRLVCSDSLLAKIDQYSCLAEKQLDSFAEYSGRLNLLDGNIQQVIQEFSKRQSELPLDSLKKDIEQIMREELRVRKRRGW